MAFEAAGIAPKVATDSKQAQQLLRQDGAVILDGIGTSADAARNIAFSLFAQEEIAAVPTPARVFDGGEKDRKREGLDHTAALFAHTDGFAYGDRYPDFISLSCVKSSPHGGENFLVDGYVIYQALQQRLQAQGLGNPLLTTPVNQTDEGMQTAISPIVQHNPNGRLMVRRTLGAQPAPNSANPAADQQLIQAWEGAIDDASTHAPRFLLNPGSAVVVDNFRVMHGREGYSSMERLLWRVWIWTQDSNGVPDLPLHSDTRYAANTSAN